MIFLSEKEESSSFKIRFAGVEDVAAITIISYDIWQDEFRSFISKDILDNINLQRQMILSRKKLLDGRKMLVMEDYNNEIIGYSSFGPVMENVGLKGFEIYSLYISKKHQSNGLGGILLLETEKKINSNKVILINVIQNNSKARKFCENNGYRHDPSNDGMFHGVTGSAAYIKN